MSTSTIRKERQVSVLEVARRANVSAATVSRVLNGRDVVGPELRRRVLSVCREMERGPSIKTRSIALIVGRRGLLPRISYVPTMISQIAMALAQEDYCIELIDVEKLDQAYSAHVDGVLAVVFDDRIKALKSIPNLPILTINAPMTEEGFHGVSVDHFNSTYQATRHLIERGHEHILMTEVTDTTWGTQERIRGFRQALEEAGLTFRPSRVCLTLQDSIHDVLPQAIDQGVTALLNFSEDTCFQALHILMNVMRLNIPQDLSVVSLEPVPIMGYMTPQQTAVRTPLEELAHAAVTRLLQAIRQPGPSPAEHLMLQPEFLPRESVAAPRSERVVKL